jgi:hypothetical protein
VNAHENLRVEPALTVVGVNDVRHGSVLAAQLAALRKLIVSEAPIQTVGADTEVGDRDER